MNCCVNTVAFHFDECLVVESQLFSPRTSQYNGVFRKHQLKICLNACVCYVSSSSPGPSFWGNNVGVEYVHSKSCYWSHYLLENISCFVPLCWIIHVNYFGTMIHKVSTLTKTDWKHICWFRSVEYICKILTYIAGSYIHFCSVGEPTTSVYHYWPPSPLLFWPPRWPCG